MGSKTAPITVTIVIKTTKRRQNNQATTLYRLAFSIDSMAFLILNALSQGKSKIIIIIV